MIIPTVLLVVGLIGLWLSGELVVRYALQLGYLSGVSTLFIGFFLISLSTGVPELFVVFNALWLGKPGLSVGDIVGSNFFDFAMGLGIPACFIHTIFVRPSGYAKTIFMVISTLLLMFFILARDQLGHWHGLLLIITYLLINWLSYKLRRIDHVDQEQQEQAQKMLHKERFLTSITGTIIKMVSSTLLVLLAAQITVSNAIKIAAFLGVPVAHLGATLIAFGTSLPELTLSITAIKNRQYDLALGNAFGSIWDQGGLMLGILALLNPTTIKLGPIRSIVPFMLIAYAIVSYSIIQKRVIDRLSGALLICSYLAFIVYELITQLHYAGLF